MTTIWDVEPARNNKTLLVFLPGVRDTAEDFRGKGIFRQVREAGIRADLVAVDAHLGYLNQGSLVQRLDEDIFAEGFKQGYEKIWLVGISLGGLNALLYLKESSQDVCGIITLSPYLGDETMIRRLQQAGSAKQWHAPAPHQRNDEEELWAWLQESVLNQVYLGYGNNDHYVDANQMLGELLPADNALIIDGKHRWATWLKLWEIFLVDFVKFDKFQQCRG